MESKSTLHFFFFICFYLIQLPLAAQTSGATGCLALDIIPSITPACSHGSPGEVTLTMQNGLPPYRVKWSDGSTATSRKLPAGDYKVQATDALGCMVSQDIHIPAHTPLQASAQVSHTSKTGKSNGQINLRVSGGVPPYRYTWISSQQGVMHAAVEGADRVRKVPAGIYQVLVYDSSGCYVEISTEVN